MSRKEKKNSFEWNELVKETRRGLGLSRKDFAILFGISLGTLNNWEYRNQIPAPMYQEIMQRLYENLDQAKKMIERRSSDYVNEKSDIDLPDRSRIWGEVAKGAIAIGVILLLCKMFSEKDH